MHGEPRSGGALPPKKPKGWKNDTNQPLTKFIIESLFSIVVCTHQHPDRKHFKLELPLKWQLEV